MHRPTLHFPPRHRFRLMLAAALFVLGIHTALAQTDPSVIRVRISVKQFANNPYIYTQQEIETFLQTLNTRLASMERGLAFELSETVTLQAQNLPATLPSRNYYTGPNISTTLQLAAWNEWWLDADPLQGCAQTIPNFQAARSPNGTAEEITPQFEYINMWQDAVKANKSAFQYRANACNFYLIWPDYCGGFGMFPGDDPDIDNLMVMSGFNDSLFLHEWGHWAGLFHTFASAEGTRNLLGDDDIADTPTDTWEADPAPGTSNTSGPQFDFLNGISLRLYGISWTNLPGGDSVAPRSEVLTMAKVAELKFLTPPFFFRRALTIAELDDIEATWTNIMSYHKHAPTLAQLNFSEGQLDKAIDNLSFVNPVSGRANVVSGLYHFVGTRGSLFLRQGSSKNPYTTVQAAVDAADPIGDDIILLRPGTYPFSGTISKPLTMRATRAGPVTLTAP
jgi:hypothetical protein